MKRYLLIIIILFLSAGSMRAQSVGLVLSGGGAKGLSHIGVLKALEENNIPVDYICGTSMGAIIGGLYAIGLSPDEMLYLFRSKEFESWYNGMPEQAYATYFYRDEATPKMFSVSLEKDKKNKVKFHLPISIVSPYPMDLAVIQIFASPAKAAGFNFDSLMIPFFCVASDIVKKEPYILKKGDLGAAIRASMTFPFYFKPITIDSTLLFDGGFYNNFPWEIMEKDYKPDFLLGVKCVTGEMSLDEEDIVSQVNNMLTIQTDYDIPQEKGMVIGQKYPFGLMDFHKVDEIVEMGYKNALPYIEELKYKIKRERTKEQLDSARLAFRTKCGEVIFSGGINIEADLDRSAKHFISRTIRNDEIGNFDFNKLKRGYYRVIASNTVKNFYPSYESNNDSLFTLKLKVSKAAPFRMDIGGNISSSSLNQAYLGLSYTHLARNPWKMSAGMNLGKYYKGGSLRWRHDIGVKPLAFYDIEVVAHQFDYYNGNQNLFTPDRIPNNVQQKEYFMNAGIATPLSIRKNLLLKFDIAGGKAEYRYYQVENFKTDDVPDKTYVDFLSPALSIRRNTLNYMLYPTAGKRELISARYIWGSESFRPGTTSNIMPQSKWLKHNRANLKVQIESYINISKHFKLGWLADLNLSNNNDMFNYLSTILYMPVFNPIPHSKSLLLAEYRANNYLGLGISPVITFMKSFYIHTTFSYFQPYQQIIQLSGTEGEYVYTDRFPRGGVIANAALVWQTPIGPISFSCAYYEKGEYNRWYPQFNIGLLLFKNKAFEY